MSPDDFEGSEVNSPALSEERKSNGVAFSESDPSDNHLISCTSVTNSMKSDQHRFGWFSYQPKCMQRLLSAKWALFWMCWAGALQGIKFKI